MYVCGRDITKMSSLEVAFVFVTLNYTYLFYFPYSNDREADRKGFFTISSSYFIFLFKKITSFLASLIP